MGLKDKLENLKNKIEAVAEDAVKAEAGDKEAAARVSSVVTEAVAGVYLAIWTTDHTVESITQKVGRQVGGPGPAKQ